MGGGGILNLFVPNELGACHNFWRFDEGTLTAGHRCQHSIQSEVACGVEAMDDRCCACMLLNFF